MYKIQTTIPFGWADIKTSFDDGKTYEIEEYSSKTHACAEVMEIILATDGCAADYRVVTIETPQDGELYI